jgi:hypothetical protein
MLLLLLARVSLVRPSQGFQLFSLHTSCDNQTAIARYHPNQYGSGLFPFESATVTQNELITTPLRENL